MNSNIEKKINASGSVGIKDQEELNEIKVKNESLAEDLLKNFSPDEIHYLKTGLYELKEKYKNDTKNYVEDKQYWAVNELIVKIAGAVDVIDMMKKEK